MALCEKQPSAAVRSRRRSHRARCWLHHADAPPRAPTAARRQAMAPLVEARGVTKHFPLGTRPGRARRRRRVARDRRARGRRPRRRERLRQVDVRPHAGRSAREDGRRGAIRAASGCPTKYTPADFRRYASRDADDLSGSVLEPESAHDGRRDHRRRVAPERPDRRGARFASASATGSRASASSAAMRRAIRTSSRAGSGSASASRAR